MYSSSCSLICFYKYLVYNNEFKYSSYVYECVECFIHVLCLQFYILHVMFSILNVIKYLNVLITLKQPIGTTIFFFLNKYFDLLNYFLM